VRAKQALNEALSDLLAVHARRLTTWPKPRAAISVDVNLFSQSAQGARPDSLCKWLLDELAGHAYSDDRQVKLLFAHVSRPQLLPPRRASGSGDDALWGTSTPAADAASSPPAVSPAPNARSQMYITVQTRANVLTDLRATDELEERWDPFDEDDGLYRRDPLEADLRRDDLMDFHTALDTDSAHDRLWRQLTRNQINYQDQEQQQFAVDRIFRTLLTDLPVDRFGVWNRVRHYLSVTPYVFDVGTLPGPGEGKAFRERFRAQLEERRERWPTLFPMRARSGISMILFEDSGAGKDLDNLVRSVLPDILDVLRPQREDLPGWVAEEPDPATATADVPFIEVAAFPAALADMPAGSVIFGLSTADRYDSWWALAAAHLERALEKAEEDDW
jgi:hypothetical protein